jgi:PAS domain S-box-containing protein
MKSLTGLVAKLGYDLNQSKLLMDSTVETSENARNSADAITRSSGNVKTEIDHTSESLRAVSKSLSTTQFQMDEIGVIGTTFESLIDLLKFMGLFETLNDPLAHLEPLAAASSFSAGNRFTSETGEVVLKPDDILISSTDTRGVITFANDRFCRIAGYQFDELVGKPHSVIRHPDMPHAAFANLWDTLMQKKIWQGFVKNKTKSGGFYWVRATVFPRLGPSGDIVGHISVRVKPNLGDVRKAVDIYRRLK